MLTGSEAGASASSGQGLWRQRESPHRETSRALSGWPGRVFSSGDPELDMAHLCLGRSLQWKKHNPGPKGVFVLVYSIIYSRNTYRVPAAFPDHRQTWAVAPTSQASESRKGSSPPSSHNHAGLGGGWRGSSSSGGHFLTRHAAVAACCTVAKTQATPKGMAPVHSSFQRRMTRVRVPAGRVS